MSEHRAFTETEDAFILEHYDKMPYRDIAASLGRTLYSIKHRTRYLGVDKTTGRRWTPQEDEIIRNRGSKTMAEIAQELGRNVSVVYKRAGRLQCRKGQLLGEYRMESGYPVCRGGSERILLHRAVMENHLGRNLQPGEIVHHIDTDERNHQPDNLCICTSGEHTHAHHTLRVIVQDLIRNGAIIYNHDRKEYEFRCETSK